MSYGKKFVDARTIRARMAQKDARMSRDAERAAETQQLSRPPIPKCPTGRSQSQEQLEADLIVERHWRQVLRTVEARDGHHCRICRKYCRLNAPTLKERGDPHHVVFVSAGGTDETANVCLLCRSCHDSVHVLRTLALSGNADEVNEFGKPRCLKLEKLGEHGWEVIGLV